jgi:hypothetical protein
MVTRGFYEPIYHWIKRGVCWYEKLLPDVENSAVGEGERAKGKKSPRRHVA